MKNPIFLVLMLLGLVIYTGSCADTSEAVVEIPNLTIGSDAFEDAVINDDGDYVYTTIESAEEIQKDCDAKSVKAYLTYESGYVGTVSFGTIKSGKSSTGTMTVSSNDIDKLDRVLSQSNKYKTDECPDGALGLGTGYL